MNLQFSKTFYAKWALILAVVLWSSAFVGIRYSMQFYSSGAMGFLRYLVAAITMTLMYSRIKTRTSHSWCQRWMAAGLGAIGFGIYSFLLNAGEVVVTAGISSFIIGLTPIFVAAFARFLYGEKLSRFAILGFIISFLGIAIIGFSELKSFRMGMGLLFIFLAMFCGGIYCLLQKRLLVKMNSREFTTYAMWGGALVLIFFTPQAWHEVHTVPPLATLTVVYMGIFPAALGYLLSSYGYSHLPVSQATSYGYWIPIVSTAMAFLVLGEIPTRLSLAGGIVALIGAVIVSRSRCTVEVG